MADPSRRPPDGLHRHDDLVRDGRLGLAGCSLGGYIGLELGTVYAALGSTVTVVELTDGLLPGCDRDLVRPLQKRVAGLFDSVLLNTKVTAANETTAGIEVSFDGEGAPASQTFGYRVPGRRSLPAPLQTCVLREDAKTVSSSGSGR